MRMKITAVCFFDDVTEPEYGFYVSNPDEAWKLMVEEGEEVNVDIHAIDLTEPPSTYNPGETL